MKKSQFIYDEVTHEWDEQVHYKLLPQFRDSYVFYPSDLRIHGYDTCDKEVMGELCQAIKEIAIWNEEDGVFIVKQDSLVTLLQDFYERGE